MNRRQQGDIARSTLYPIHDLPMSESTVPPPVMICPKCKIAMRFAGDGGACLLCLYGDTPGLVPRISKEATRLIDGVTGMFQTLPRSALESYIASLEIRVQKLEHANGNLPERGGTLR
jgi:hypothetical protein